MLNKFSFISYSVSNLQRSIIFYRDLLGLKLVLSNNIWAEFNADGQRLAIYEKKNSTKLGGDSGAIVYFEANPIESMVEILKIKGVKFIGNIEKHAYGKLILFTDLDNNFLGLYEPPEK